MSDQFYVIVPAAGVGSRMQAERPKSYLSLGNDTIFSITLKRLLAVPTIRQILVMVSPNDHYWQKEPVVGDARISVEIGGAERCLSVLNGLNALQGVAAPEDWVLVHDVARPCVRVDEIEQLMQQLKDDPVGGILATPIKDTLKQVNSDGVIAKTIPREQLWAALTPQMFRYHQLMRALEPLASNPDLISAITDEASAVERLGLSVKIVPGSANNIKVTLPEDLQRAATILQTLPNNNAIN